MDEDVREATKPTLARIAQEERRVSAEVARLLRHTRAHLLDEGFGEAAVKLAFGQEAADLIAAFAAERGIRFAEYVAEARVEVAARLLLESKLSIARISRLLGYRTTSVFSNTVERYLGYRPGRLRAVARSAVDAPLPPQSAGNHLRLPNTERSRIGSRLAEGIWELLAPWSFAEQVAYLRHNALLGTEDLFDLLSRQSREAGRHDRRRGVELAELALATVEGSAALLRRRYDDLRALALARLGNACRLAADLDRADDAFRRLDAVWGEGTKDRRVEAEICFLRGSLRLFQRRLDEALESLDRTLAIAKDLGDVDWQLNALLQRAALNRYRDRLPDMLCDLSAARELLETQAEPDRCQLLGVFQELTLAHLEMGNSAEARRYLPQAKALCEALDHGMSRCQLQWLEGGLARLDGDDAAAERLFRLARAGFLDLGDRVTAALAATDLAMLCHTQGRFTKVMALAVADVIPVLAEVGLDDEAAVALRLLREAVAAEALTLAVLRKARAALRHLPPPEVSPPCRGTFVSPGHKTIPPESLS